MESNGMNFELKDLSTKIAPFAGKLKKYMVFLFVVFVLLLISFLVFRVNQYSKRQPSELDVTEKLQAIPRPRVDEDVVTRIQNLRDQNIQVKTLFQEARNNPFAE